MCVADMDDLLENFPDMEVEGDSVVGWIEKDGEPGKTSDDEVFHVNDFLEEGVDLHIECNVW